MYLFGWPGLLGGYIIYLGANKLITLANNPRAAWSLYDLYIYHLYVTGSADIWGQAEGCSEPQGLGVERSHTSCGPHQRTPAGCFTGALIVQIYHPCHWCSLSQEPLKTKEHHPKPDVSPDKSSVQPGTEIYTAGERMMGLWITSRGYRPP